MFRNGVLSENIDRGLFKTLKNIEIGPIVMEKDGFEVSKVSENKMPWATGNARAPVLHTFPMELSVPF